MENKLFPNLAPGTARSDPAVPLIPPILPIAALAAAERREAVDQFDRVDVLSHLVTQLAFDADPQGGTVALVVDVDGVVSAGRGTFVPSDAAEEHPIVQGFLELEGHPTVTILEPRALIERLSAMKYLKRNED